MSDFWGKNTKQMGDCFVLLEVTNTDPAFCLIGLQSQFVPLPVLKFDRIVAKRFCTGVNWSIPNFLLLILPLTQFMIAYCVGIDQ